MSLTKEQKDLYKRWRSLVNMTKGELKKFYDSPEGKAAGLSKSEAKKQGISSGRESALWIMRMKSKKHADWSPEMWKWAKKQVSFIKRMSGVKGDLYEEDGETKTTKHTALLIWGHNPKKLKMGGDLQKSSEKTNLVLLKKDIQNVIQDRTQKDKDLIQKAAFELERNEKDQQSKGKITHSDEESILKGALPLIENDQFNADSYLNEGGEQKVYLIRDGFVTKLNDGNYHNNWLEYLHRLLLHNYLFPSVSYELIGWTENDNVLYLVVEQPYIVRDHYAKEEEIKEELNDHGFKNIRNTDGTLSLSYKSRDLDLWITDLHLDNVFWDDDQLYFIDPLIMHPEYGYNTNEFKRGGLLDKVFYHVSDQEITKVKPYLHIGTKEAAERRSEDYNYGNNAIYYKVKFARHPKGKLVSDRLANLFASHMKGIDISKEATNDELKEIERIKRLGYSALKYNNDIEGDISYLVINPDLVKIERIMAQGGQTNDSVIENLILVMDSKISSQGYSLKELYDEVIKLQGSKDGALIFSEFIKRKKDAGDEKIMKEFEKTSFVENIVSPKPPKEDNISDIIAGLELLKKSVSGKAKKELEDAIAGLKLVVDIQEDPKSRLRKGGNVKKIPIIDRPENKGIKSRNLAKISAEKELRSEDFQFDYLKEAYGRVLKSPSWIKSDEKFKSFDLYTKKIANGIYKRAIVDLQGNDYYLTSQSLRAGGVIKYEPIATPLS